MTVERPKLSWQVLDQSRVPAAELASVFGTTEQRAEFIYADIRNKRRTATNLHRRPVLVEPVREVEPRTEA